MDNQNNIYENHAIEKTINVPNGSTEEVWNNIKAIWNKSTLVLRGPSGFYGNTYPELDILFEFIKKYNKEAECFFMKGLSDQNPYIVAYSLVGLSILKSPMLANLPNDIFNRKETINWSIAFLRKTTTLGYFANLYKDAEKVQTKQTGQWL